MKIEIVYALPYQANILRYDVSDNCTVEQALIQSQFLSKNALNLADHQVGIYGRRIELDHLLQEGDRIEIYRPLLNDPKEIRRRRAKQSK